jgi:hypothetical protein
VKNYLLHFRSVSSVFVESIVGTVQREKASMIVDFDTSKLFDFKNCNDHVGFIDMPMDYAMVAISEDGKLVCLLCVKVANASSHLSFMIANEGFNCFMCLITYYDSTPLLNIFKYHAQIMSKPEDMCTVVNSIELESDLKQ